MRINDVLIENTQSYNEKSFTQEFIDDLLEKLHTDYSEAWNIVYESDGDEAIYRSDHEMQDAISVGFKTPDPERKAAFATYNFHTLWMNNNEQWSNFPKRSIICSTDDENVKHRSGMTTIVIPKNGSKIGLCPESDIFDSFSNIEMLIDEVKGSLEIFYDELKGLVQDLRIFSTISGIKIKNLSYGLSYSEARKVLAGYDELVDHMKNNPRFYKDKDIDNYIVAQTQYSIYEYYILQRETIMPGIYRYMLNNGFLKSFDELFSPKEFEIVSYSDAIDSGDTYECWLDQPCILMTFEAFEDIAQYYEQYITS